MFNLNFSPKSTTTSVRGALRQAPRETSSQPRGLAKQSLLWLSHHRDHEEEPTQYREREMKTLGGGGKWAVLGKSRWYMQDNSDSFHQYLQGWYHPGLPPARPDPTHLLPWKVLAQTGIQTCSYQLRASHHLLPLPPEGEGRKTGKTTDPAETKA